MKRTLFYLLICAFTTLVPLKATAVQLTLDECLRIALSDNPTIKVADMEVERMDYSKIETLSQLLPQASFVGTYNRTLAKQMMYMNTSSYSTDDPSSDESSSGTTGFKVGMDNSYSVGFSASVPLIAPQLWASLKLSDSQIAQSVEEARASKLDMVNQVKNAYYALMLAYDSRRVIQESYDMAALTHDIYVKQHEAGAASDYDVLRTSVAVKNIIPELLQADIAIKQARLQLLILMGMDTTFDITVEGDLSQYEKTMFEETIAINPDYSDNSSLILNDIQADQLKQSLKMQWNSLYPTLSADFSYLWNSMSDGSPFKNFQWTPYSYIGLTLNIPLFTGGQRYSKIKQAKIQVEEMTYQRENLERTVAMQVDLAVDNIKANVEQIVSCSESVKQAERAHDIQEQSFKIGATSYLDLRDSELSLTQSRLSYYQAIYNYLVAQSDLELLLGNAPLTY